MLAKTETAGLHNFQMKEQSLVDEIKSGNRVITENGGKKAVAEENLDVTLKELSSDVTTLEGLCEACFNKAQDYEAATKSCEEELKEQAQVKRVTFSEAAGADSIAHGLRQISVLQLKSGSGLSNFQAVPI